MSVQPAPTIEYIRYRIPADRAEQFVTAYTAAALPLQASPYCLGFEVTRCVEEPEQFTVRIHWSSVGDHLTGFRRSAQFREFFVHIAAFVDQIEEMQHYCTALAG